MKLQVLIMGAENIMNKFYDSRHVILKHTTIYLWQ